MKKTIYLIILFAAIRSHICAQTGNIGIGTTTPGTKLHVVNPGTGGTGVLNTNTANMALRLENNQNGQSVIQHFLAKDAGGATKEFIQGINPTFNSGNGVFYLGTNGSNTQSITMDLVSGNIGIGNSSPRTKLDISGALAVGAGNIPNSINMSYIAFNALRPGVGESEFVNYRGTGSGGFRFYSIANSGAPSYPTNAIAFIDITGAYFQTSDLRLKSNISTVENGLKTVMALNPVAYDMQKRRSIGFIAQELYNVVPEAVDKPTDEAAGLYTVSYTTMVPILTKAIQEQQAQIEKLSEEVGKLKRSVNKKRRRLL